MTRFRLLALAVAALVAASRLPAQQLAADCPPAMDSLWAAASSACIGAPETAFCNGGGPLEAEPAGPVANTLAASGAIVDSGAVDAVRTPPTDLAANHVGAAWLRLPAPLQYTALLIGELTLRDVTPEGFPAWTSVILETAPEPAACPVAPNNLLVLQTPAGLSTRVVVNGASLALSGTVVAHTVGTETVFVAISGESSVQVFGSGQPLLMGQQVSVPYAPGDFSRPTGVASPPVPYDPAPLRNLPIALLPRPIVLPQPGYVVTGGVVNMRSGPSTDAGIITQVPPAEAVSVMGRDPTGAWYHVRRETGETGWMLAELLTGNVGPIQAVYAATPLPPQRYGELGTTGRVIAPEGVNLRTGPDATFPALGSVGDGALVQLVARSPYSPWVKVDVGGTLGWVALIALETRAFYDALPIDHDVPPPPTPTRLPGSWGNAFPDPTGN